MKTIAHDPVSDAAFFEPSMSGYLRHWLVAGPGETPYAGAPGPEHVLRREALDDSPASPPPPAVLGKAGPFELPWHFHDPGRNEFVEFSTFYQELTVVEYFAFTELETFEGGERRARFWAAGMADLWVNEHFVTRLTVTRYRYPDSQPVMLPLRPGANRLCVRLQCLGIRDTRILFGLCMERPDGVVIRMQRAARIAPALQWIDSVRAPARDTLESAGPPPIAARAVPAGRDAVPWPAGSSELSLGPDLPASLAVEAAIDGVVLRRELEIPANLPPAALCEGDRRMAHLSYVAKAGIGGEFPAHWNAIVLPLLARRLLQWPSEQDDSAFADAIAMVDARLDCADFVLAGLLRMERLKLCSAKESAAIRRAALGFRYWPDEPGADAMCYHSENHSLLFHGCQLLAGELFPTEIFKASGRTGREQAALALSRIRQWLEKIEARGFEEFNSSTYMPITVAAMLNIVDFSDDADLSVRMSRQIDRIFRDVAQHTFHGAVVSPQGRVYRNVLYPEESGTQMLLAFATDAAGVDLAGPRPPRERSGDWVVFPASASKYRPPEDLTVLIHEPVSRVYRHAEFQILLEKTPAYILTSLAVPAEPRPGEHPDNDLRPGGAGYQQHLWQASLGAGCHIFVNHPGGFFDGTKSRPGYWHGNGLLPRVRQEGNWLQAIHVIPDGNQTSPEITPEVWQWAGPSTVRPFDRYPIVFTHVHWPTDAFDREERRGNWIFGQKGRGLIGVWCSEPLVPHDDVLTGRELRAYGHASAWLVICGDVHEASMETFLARCEARAPFFDRRVFSLTMKDEEPTRWWERQEPMPA